MKALKQHLWHQCLGENSPLVYKISSFFRNQRGYSVSRSLHKNNRSVFSQQLLLSQKGNITHPLPLLLAISSASSSLSCWAWRLARSAAASSWIENKTDSDPIGNYQLMQHRKKELLVMAGMVSSIIQN